ncbi:ZinT/AdcA family metal-binding protein [Dethiosulfatarculus sandiegensis]|uniref:ZinT domain-containing protein n=1 Tax=Dethiosulfatarculus sandiegensis TaxID=1429043 RepID=A0A0D2K223_9BACT|nr:ZinT/AdcA family metal-binding protein [Dethiosulfatarculus sandiegensis]KIX15725.1 hypothetical protein X474_02765 [Dethiosulfatarculus sandiegensis]
MKRVILLLLSLLLISATAVAATLVTDLSPWQGEYISRITLIRHPDMQPLYRDTAKAAAVKGKSYTSEQVKAHLARTFRTDFGKIKIKGNSITFYPLDKASSPLTRAYTYAGEKSDSYGKMKFSWHGFTADTKDAPYKFLLMMKPHQHNKGVPHFHFRYSNKSFKAIIGPEIEYWWPTFLPLNVDVKEFRKGTDPKLLARLLP